MSQATTWETVCDFCRQWVTGIFHITLDRKRVCIRCAQKNGIDVAAKAPPSFFTCEACGRRTPSLSHIDARGRIVCPGCPKAIAATPQSDQQQSVQQQSSKPQTSQPEPALQTPRPVMRYQGVTRELF